MCYSKEVQLISSLMIIIPSIIYYFYYKKRYNEWQNKILNNIIVFFLCIGTHQFFEFLSIITGNEIIYKIGLIVSLSSVYFLIKSLELFIQRKIYSEISLIFVVFVAVQLFLDKVSFEPFLFYVRHYSAFIWSGLYLFVFIYWNLTSIDSSSKNIFIYMFCVADASFILSVVYVLYGYFFHGINVCTDSPSIWCTFFVVQCALLPLFLSKLPKIVKRKTRFTKPSLLFFLSLIILTLLILVLLFFNCLNPKFIFG